MESRISGAASVAPTNDLSQGMSSQHYSESARSPRLKHELFQLFQWEILKYLTLRLLFGLLKQLNNEELKGCS
jgi:hypothetical protein